MNWLLGAVAAVAMLVGCGGDDGSEDEERSAGATAECMPQVRFQGAIYSGADYSTTQVTKAGEADEAKCDDVGETAAGSHFPADPLQVDVWAFDGFPTNEVVGVRQGDLLGVYISEDVSAEREAQIVAELGQDSD